MTKLALYLIARLTPAADREAILGDTLERLEELRCSHGGTHAQRWLWRETARVVWLAPRHHLAARSGPTATTEPERHTHMATLSQDIRYALRWLRRSPGLTTVAVLTLALGVGANTAMFSVVNALMLKPLPFADADRLMLVHLLAPDREAGVYGEVVWSYPKFRTFASVQQVFENAALFGSRQVSLSGGGEAERVDAEIVTESYGDVLGVRPLIGRAFTADEANVAGAAPVAMISNGLWVRRYGGDPAILDRRILIGGVPHAVVAVLPRGFRGLNGDADVWVPLAVADDWALKEAQGHSYMMVARRKADTSEASAMAAVRVYGGQVAAAHRDDFDSKPWGASALSLYASRTDTDVRRASFVILAAVSFVLLIACVNLTNLLVAGAIGRRREVAVRVALGAGRSRIVRQFVAEGVLLSAMGTLAGLLVAFALLAVAAYVLPDSAVFFRSAVAPGTPRISGAPGLTKIGAAMIGLDGATLLFAAGLACLTAILVSILPALQAANLQPVETLKSAGGTASARGSRGFGSTGSLVAVEIALALLLLSGAGLMLKSAAHLRSTELGIEPDRVLTLGLSLPPASYTRETGRNLYLELAARVNALPGVESAGLGSCAPVSARCNGTLLWFPPNESSPNSPQVNIHWATPGYFDALRIPIVEGRNFTDRDRAGQPKVVLVNQTAARMFWPHGTAIGQRIAVGQGGFHDGAEVIGVVGDVRYRAIESAAGPQVYVPVAQAYRGEMRFFVRSTIDTASLAAALAREVHGLDPNLPLIDVKTMAGYVGDAMWRTRVATWLLSAFAALALLLTAIGVFGVMAQTVAQRTPEFGIRMALGAQRRDVLSLVFRRGALITGLGLAAGLVATLSATRVIGALLYGVSPNDPATLAAVAAALALVSLVACYIPARRAMRVDAIVALRNE